MRNDDGQMNDLERGAATCFLFWLLLIVLFATLTVGLFFGIGYSALTLLIVSIVGLALGVKWYRREFRRTMVDDSPEGE